MKNEKLIEEHGFDKLVYTRSDYLMMKDILSDIFDVLIAFDTVVDDTKVILASTIHT